MKKQYSGRRRYFAVTALMAGLTAVMILPSGKLAAQNAELPVLTLQDFLDSSMKNGDEIRIVEGNLAAARAQYALTAGKDSTALSASGSYGLGAGIGSTLTSSGSIRSLLGGTYPGFAHSFQGSLALVRGTQSASNPDTRLGLSLSQNFPYQTSSSPYPGTVLGITASQSLWDGFPGGQTKAAVEKAAITLKNRELTAAQSRSLIALNVKKAYITMLSTQRSLSVRLGILEKQDSLLKQVTAIHSMRQASLVDLQNASINARTASLDVETARHDLALARQRLAVIAGMSPDAAFSVGEISEPVIPAESLEEAIAIGLEKRLELGLAELNRRFASIDLALAKGQADPAVIVSGGVNFALLWSSPALVAGSASLGLRVGMPILDAGASRSLADSSQSLIAVYDTQKAQLAKTIAAEIRDAYWMVSIQTEKISLARQSADLYATKLAIVKAQQSFGTASLQELLSASVDAANAESAWAAAKSAHLLSILALEAAMGL